jgi:penicillin amidase
MKRRARRLLAAAAVVLVVGVALVVWALRASLPPLSGTARLAGLSGPVTVIRDGSGVPHVFASSASDAQRGLGWVQAQDRRLMMELARRLALGRLAEIAGDGEGPPIAIGPVFATNALDADRQMRALGLEALARRELELMSAANRVLLEAWVDGVNAATASGAAGGMIRVLGVPVEPWTALDSVAAMKLVSLTYAFGGWEELRHAGLVRQVGEAGVLDFLPPYPEDWAPPVVDGPPGGTGPAAPRVLLAAAGGPAAGGLAGALGSNNWVVDGRRSATGAPVLANDPHVEVNPPAVYVAHVAAPDFAAIGTTTFGLGFLQGHNGRIAWGITLAGADAQDLVVEELAPDAPPRRRTPDGWEPLRVRRETIRVRGRSAPVVHEVQESAHGPLLHTWSAEESRQLVADRPALHASAFAWTGGVAGPPDALLDVARAGDWSGFRAALARYPGTPLNFVYADRSGHIGYQLAGYVPQREGAAALTPRPGWQAGHDWTGMLPFEELPSLYDPPDGIIVTANARITGPRYPHHLSTRWGDVPLRARRIRALLDTKSRLTLDDMAAIQLDVQQDRLAELASWAALAAGDDPSVRRFRDGLAAWDLRADVASAGAAMADALRLELVHAVFAPRLSPATFEAYLWAGHGTHLLALERALGDEQARFFGPDPQAARRARADAVSRAVHRAIARLEGAMGADWRAWQWGRIHTVTFEHPLAQGPLGGLFRRAINVGPLPAPGSSFTIDAGWWAAARPFALWIAPMYRQIVDLADPGRSRWTPPPPGASEHPLSRYARDRAKAWVAGRHRPMPWTRAQVEAEAGATLVLVPGGS